MSKFIKVEHSQTLVRDIKSNAIVNNSTEEYKLYMARAKRRENSLNEMKDICREINTLKAEMYEIKDILKSLCKDKK
jgi:hypothetical protein|tara:strand:- start:204 stop:434 length:231 start_codon:yes stop_codon:yes gene_type:complete